MMRTLPTLVTEGSVLVDKRTIIDTLGVELTPNIDDQTSVLVTRKTNTPGQIRNNRPFCKYCKKPGRMIEEC